MSKHNLAECQIVGSAIVRTNDGQRRASAESFGSGGLTAVLLNPPAVTTGIRTRNAVAKAGLVLGYSTIEVVNLCSAATPSVVELNRTQRLDGWLDARPALVGSLRTASGVLAAWGVAGMTGAARLARDDQVAWLYDELLKAGIDRVWTVGGEPRHPSRWHQFVSDKYGRTSGGCFEQRLSEVLVATPI
ncbi:hypothetical protein [Cellulomonas sp. P5_C6]